ncbi:MAG TPA: plasmid pRiA4b ORF-3 family protein [Candidatus Aquicultor sp.]|jgi:hypothetical protein
MCGVKIVDMKKKFDNVYQFKIALKGIKPLIWRSIQVPETYNFWDLHVAIQDAMGWSDSHLHEFEMKDPLHGIKSKIGIPVDDFDLFPYEHKVLPERNQKIADWFSKTNTTAKYTYDFGDDWVHDVRLEKILSRGKDFTYPRCLTGERACPPEDCGGVWGYEDLLEIIRDPNHKEYEDIIEWLDGELDSEHFSIEEVEFDDPAKRWKLAFG